MSDTDTLLRFLFERTDVRGNLVHLDASWRAVLDAHDYPEPVRGLLGEALAAVSLLAATIKFDGSLILQAQGDGPLRTLVAQATNTHKVRGLARWDATLDPDATLTELFGQGRLVLTVEPRVGEPYQGIVALQGERLSEALEHFFSGSEQLPTRLWLAADAERAAGLLLQRLPSAAREADDWSRVGMLAATLSREELLELPAEQLLYRLFNEEPVRLFEPEPIAFRCGCSRARIEQTVKLLGADEIEALLAERGALEVNCEFCNRTYHFDPVDARQLLAEDSHHTPPSQHQ
ncbi:Hsp33 family molecular chaperone HslO [Marichromatium bheemlicum]|uniref:33 kDa chaperonin n=1 Tax=Marichromatium bheemlicum TaxID=365339 RepID=A0ABX1I853_9GAMM|nr:Hsp33 family molecular chaperone HslO [Marichromatium bheemlicum]NKN32575.1 Hsp33 family molecular chaperone HslO [Marichromatium bheemlicum]